MVPLNPRVFASKVSQLGNASPFASLAVTAKVSPKSTSANT